MLHFVFTKREILADDVKAKYVREEVCDQTCPCIVCHDLADSRYTDLDSNATICVCKTCECHYDFAKKYEDADCYVPIVHVCEFIDCHKICLLYTSPSPRD